MPNVVTMTQRGYNALWSLQYPVAKDSKGLPYYRYIRTNYNAITNGDFACAPTCATRNPFYHGADAVFFGNWRYELAKLDVPVQGDRPGFKVPSIDYHKGNRNTATFLHVLSVFKANPTADFHRLMEAAESFQSEQQAPSLSLAENVGIVKNILRNGTRYSFTGGNHNRGILGLPKRDGFLPLEEFRAMKAKHQAIGAAYARGCLVGRTEARIQAAVDSLQGEVNISAVARVAGASRNTVRKYLSGGVLGGGQSAVSRIVS